MTILTTDIHDIPFPDDDEAIASYPAQLQALAEHIDLRLLAWSEGVVAALPEITPEAPGNGRRGYRATDTGTIFIDAVDHWIALVGSDDGGLSPVGAQSPYCGIADPAGGKWLICDGRLLDRGTAAGASFFAVAGHRYNGGADPGDNKVRLPDKRGRTSVGADSMGAGAANRIGEPNDVGENGGEEKHQLAVAELASHDHPNQHNTTAGEEADFGLPAAPQIHFTNRVLVSGAMQETKKTGPRGGNQAHNNMQPYEVDSWIVRVL